MNWSQRLRARRKAMGVSQVALAVACKVSQPSVSDWESGETKMIEGLPLVLAAKALKTSPEWLMTGKHDLSHVQRLTGEIVTGAVRGARRASGKLGSDHFLVEEDPAQFAGWLREVLALAIRNDHEEGLVSESERTDRPIGRSSSPAGASKAGTKSGSTRRRARKLAGEASSSTEARKPRSRKP